MSLVKPHGSDTLVALLLEGEALAAELARAQSLKKVFISSRESGDLIMLGIGGFTPLTGFMGKDDWHSVCTNMQLSNGLFWPIPITLSTTPATADTIAIGEDVALVDSETNEIMGTMTVSEKYSIDKTLECQEVFRTTDAAHPGVKMVMEQGDINLAGTVKVLSQGEFPTKYADTYMTPAQTRALFEEKGWKTIAAFKHVTQCTVHTNT
jgi:sulfate adenylyltransferase